MASIKLSDKAVGSIIRLRHNGTLRDFWIVHQGKPSAMYDDSCDGTMILQKEVYDEKQWNSAGICHFGNSDVFQYLNRDYLNGFDSSAVGAIKQVRIPYVPDWGNVNVADKENGLFCKVFLLAPYEIGWGSAQLQHLPADGAKLDFFLAGGTTEANNKRIAYQNGAAAYWWLRTPSGYTGNRVYVVDPRGWSGYGTVLPTIVQGIRPAFILPSTLLVADDGTIQWNTPPGIPSSITVPESIMTGKPVAVSWGKSSDPEGDAVSYEAERAADGAAFTRIYAGTALSCTETAGMGWGTVQYRVRAVDSKGATAGYVTSPIRNVVHNVDPTVSGADTDLGTVTATPSYPYQVGDADTGDVLTVTETLDGAVIRTIRNAVRGTGYTAALTREQFFALAAGQHRLTITVTDDRGNAAARNVLFSREVAAVDFDTAPREADARPEQALVNLRYTASDENVTLEVCNNGFDETPAWEPASPKMKHNFTNMTKTAAKWGVMARVRITPSAEYPQLYATPSAWRTVNDERSR